MNVDFTGCKKIPVFIFFIFLPVFAYGQQTEASLKTGSFTLFQFNHHRSISSDNIEYRDWDVFTAIPVITSKDLSFIVLPTFSHTHVNKVGFALPNDDFYEAFLPIIVQIPISSSKNAGAIILPGVASNFDGSLNTRDFNFFGALYIANSQTSRFQYRYGIFYSRSVNGNIILPAATFDWRITNRLNLDVNNPINPDITYRIGPRLRGGVEYSWTTREYNLHNGMYLKDVNSRLDPHLDIQLYKHVVFTARGGYAFQRDLETYKNVDIGSSWYEGFKDNKPLNRQKHEGWFIEVGLSYEIWPAIK